MGDKKLPVSPITGGFLFGEKQMIGKKETSMESEVLVKTNQNKIIKPLLSSQVDFHLKNLNRLIDQDIYWFCERIESFQVKDFSRTSFIEKTYLIPLQRKIKEIAERMLRL